MEGAVMSPKEVHALLAQDPAVTYVDVRTVAEFAAGHPKGNVVNIPFGFVQPVSKAVVPNESFVEIIENLYEKDARLIAGCDGGKRAAQAAERLLAAGYTDVSVMPEGLPGWQRHDLPVTRDNSSGISYVSLLTKARRKGKTGTDHD